MNLKSLKNIALILIAIGSAVFLIEISVDIYRFLIFPYQNEGRQVAFMPLVNGLVPMNAWFSESQTPNNLYVYGFVYPFLIKIFPLADKLLASKLISALSLLFSAGLLAITYLKFIDPKKRKEAWTIIPILICLFFITGTQAVLSSTPTALGQFLFLSCIFIPFLIRNKGGLLFAAICGILAFYSKPYYALSLPFAAIAIFSFDSKRRAVDLFNIATPIFLVSVILIHLYWPGYFTRTFFTHLGYPIHGKWSHLLFQLEIIFTKDFLLLLAFVFTTIFLFKKIVSKVDMKNFNNPLIHNNNPIAYSAVLISLFGFLMFMGSMGKHVGSSYGHYFYHLVYPFLLLIIITSINKNFKLDLLLFVLVAFHLIYSQSIYQSNKYLDILKLENKRTEIFLSQFDEVLNTGNVAGILYNQNKKVYDNGNMEYFFDGRNHFFGDFENYVSIYSDFQNGIMEKIEKSEFDLLMNNPNMGPYIFPGDSKRKNYSYLGSIKIRNPKGESLERLFVRKELKGSVKVPEGMNLIQEFKN